MTCAPSPCDCPCHQNSALHLPCHGCRTRYHPEISCTVFDLTGPGPRVNIRSEIDYGPAILRALQDIAEKLDKLDRKKYEE